MNKVAQLLVLLIGLASCVVERKEAAMYDEQIGAAEPVKVKSWSAFGKLVRGAELDRLVSLQTPQFDEPGVYTIEFSLNADVSDVPPSPEATIEWSVEGNTVVRKVTVGQGISISGTGQAVRITVRDNSRVGAGAEYSVTILVSPGTRAIGPTPPMYFHLSQTKTIAAAGNASIDFPVNAGITSIWVGAAATTPSVTPANNEAVVQLIDTDTAAVLSTFTVQPSRWSPVPPGVDKVTLYNPSAVQQQITVIFGIDG